MQDAGLANDVDALLDGAQRDIEEVSESRFIRLVEAALRHLNSPATLSTSPLIDRIPFALRDMALDPFAPAGLPPLERAQLLRAFLIASAERLRPSQPGESYTAALQYQILREEYLEGRPNREIMTRHNVSESTFHRNRREAIAVLARDLLERERLLAGRSTSHPPPRDAPAREIGSL